MLNSNTLHKFNKEFNKNIGFYIADYINKNNVSQKELKIILAENNFFSILLNKDNGNSEMKKRYQLSRIINEPRSKWDTSEHFFIDFGLLSQLVEEVHLNTIEKAEIIFHVLERNLHCHLINACFDEEKNNLCQPYKQAYKVDILSIAKNHLEIKRHYFDKLPNLSEEDIEIVINILREYNLNDQICDEVKGLLIRTSLPFLKKLHYMVGNSINSTALSLQNDSQFITMNEIRSVFSAALYAWLTYPETVHNNKIVICSFQNVEYLLGKNFGAKDFFNILCYIAKSNIEMGILTEARQPYNLNLDRLKQVYQMYYKNNLTDGPSFSQFCDKIAQIYRVAIFTTPVKQGVTDLIDSNDIDYPLTQEAHQILKDHYFTKKDNFNNDDIFMIGIAFGKLGISPKGLKMIDEFLNDELKSREQSREKETPHNLETSQRQSNWQVNETKAKPTLSKKAYNQIFREILTYFNIKEMKAFRYLTVDEIIYCINLMKKIGLADEIIDTFINKTEKENRKYEINPLNRYSELLQKMEYYSTNPQIMHILNDLKEAYEAIKLDENDPFYEEFIASGMAEIMKLIPENHEYEMMKALKLVNQDNK